GAHLAGVEGVVVVGVEVDGDAGHRRLPAVADAVTVAVLELGAVQLAEEGRVGEVEAGDRQAGQRLDVVRPGGGGRLPVAAGGNLPDPPAAPDPTPHRPVAP